MAERVLTTRELNRALLGRQLLLERQRMSASDAIEHLVGMQAQNPLDPYYALWSRLEGFQTEELAELVRGREAVRAVLMRGTIHLVTAGDCLALYPVMASVPEKLYRSTQFAKDMASVDETAFRAAVAALVAERPHTRKEIAAEVAHLCPDVPPASVGWAASYLVPMLQVPPRGVWGETMQATLAGIETFLGKPFPADDNPAEAIVRYLRAFGPAAPKDIRTWCTKTGLAPVIVNLRGDLVAYRDENGAELLDVPDGLFPDPETPAPVRFLPEYDNAFLSHADRTRISPQGVSPRTWWKGLILVDGFGAGTWKLERGKGGTTVHIEPWAKWSKADRAEVTDEADRLAAFAAT